MKIQIVMETYCVENTQIPNKVIHEFDAYQAGSVQLHVQPDGTKTISLRKDENSEPYKEWKLKRRIVQHVPINHGSNELEEIIKYVVVDPNAAVTPQPSEHNDGEKTFDDVSGGNLDSYDEGPEFRRRKTSND